MSVGLTCTIMFLPSVFKIVKKIGQYQSVGIPALLPSMNDGLK